MDPDSLAHRLAEGKRHVWDETGQRYLDLTAAFGVAAVMLPSKSLRPGKSNWPA